MLMLLASAIGAALASPDSHLLLMAELFLLGWGWNLGYGAGSSLLTGALKVAERPRVQGVSGALIWSTP